MDHILWPMGGEASEQVISTFRHVVRWLYVNSYKEHPTKRLLSRTGDIITKKGTFLMDRPSSSVLLVKC